MSAMQQNPDGDRPRHHVSLTVIPPPDYGQTTVLALADSGTVFLVGEADPVSYDCGNCGSPLLLDIEPEQAQDAVLRCPACGGHNLSPNSGDAEVVSFTSGPHKSAGQNVTYLAELRAKADAATPGPWWNESGVIHAPIPGRTDGAAVHPASCEQEEDADFIATFDPDTVKALLRVWSVVDGELSGPHWELTFREGARLRAQNVEVPT